MVASGFTIAELDYVLHQTAPYESGHTIAPTDKWIDSGLETIQTSLISDPTYSDLRNTLSQIKLKLSTGSITAASAAQISQTIAQALEFIYSSGLIDVSNRLITLLQDSIPLVVAGFVDKHHG